MLKEYEHRLTNDRYQADSALAYEWGNRFKVPARNLRLGRNTVVFLENLKELSADMAAAPPLIDTRRERINEMLLTVAGETPFHVGNAMLALHAGDLNSALEAIHMEIRRRYPDHVPTEQEHSHDRPDH